MVWVKPHNNARVRPWTSSHYHTYWDRFAPDSKIGKRKKKEKKGQIPTSFPRILDYWPSGQKVGYKEYSLGHRAKVYLWQPEDRATWSKPCSLWRAFSARILSSHIRLHDYPVTRSLNGYSDLSPYDWAHHQDMTPVPAYHVTEISPRSFPVPEDLNEIVMSPPSTPRESLPPTPRFLRIPQILHFCGHFSF